MKEVADTIVLANSLSSHNLIGTIRKTHVFTLRKAFVRDFSKYNREQLKNDLRQKPWEQMFLTNDFNQWLEFV